MRIITDDNIQQLENMTFSKNIEHLTFKPDVEPNHIIMDNIQMLATAEPHQYTPYDEEAQDIIKITTPPMAPYSPPETAFAPVEANRNATSPVYNPNTPLETPPMAPYSPYKMTDSELAKVAAEAEEAKRNATSPLYNPNTPETAELNELSQLAREYHTGDNVYYRGDTLPYRLWQVTSVGDKYIKIETNTPSTDNMDMIKMVTANDLLYRPDSPDYPPLPEVGHQIATPPYAPSYNSSPGALQNGGNYPAIHPVNGGGPNITFAPVIKVMNGGSDFSNGQEPTTTAVDALPKQFSDGVITQPIETKHEDKNTASTPAQGNTMLPESSSGTIDFNNLVIKKQP